jgi:hypothetical protein
MSVRVRAVSATRLSSRAADTGGPAYAWISRARAIASAFDMRMQACEAALPRESSSGVPCMKTRSVTCSFTRPTGLVHPGGVTFSLRAQARSGGCHHGFHVA